MSDHLPECREALIPDFENQRWMCICNHLRACEQRVNDEWVRDYGGHRAFALGVQAAREAVMRTCGHTKYEGCSPCLHDDALAAIDALRGKP